MLHLINDDHDHDDDRDDDDDGNDYDDNNVNDDNNDDDDNDDDDYDVYEMTIIMMKMNDGKHPKKKTAPLSRFDLN